jgi:hypothetical protein
LSIAVFTGFGSVLVLVAGGPAVGAVVFELSLGVVEGAVAEPLGAEDSLGAD